MSMLFCALIFFFFFNDTATTEIYTLSLHDALPISWHGAGSCTRSQPVWRRPLRSEEHTSELQSHSDLVCRLLLEKKKTAIRAHWQRPCAQLSARTASRVEQPA